MPARSLSDIYAALDNALRDIDALREEVGRGIDRLTDNHYWIGKVPFGFKRAVEACFEFSEHTGYELNGLKVKIEIKKQDIKSVNAIVARLQRVSDGLEGNWEKYRMGIESVDADFETVQRIFRNIRDSFTGLKELLIELSWKLQFIARGTSRIKNKPNYHNGLKIFSAISAPVLAILTIFFGDIKSVADESCRL